MVNRPLLCVMEHRLDENFASFHEMFIVLVQVPRTPAALHAACYHEHVLRARRSECPLRHANNAGTSFRLSCLCRVRVALQDL